MVAVWVHDMGDFKKVTVTSSGDDPDAYAEKWWGLGRLIWSREVEGTAEGKALQKAILEAGDECNPSDFIPDTKLTGKTCYVGDVDFNSLTWEVPQEPQYYIYLAEVDEIRVRCGYSSKGIPEEDVLWAFKVSTLDKAKEFCKFVHGRLSKVRNIVNGVKCFVPSGTITQEYCVAQYKEWLSWEKPSKSASLLKNIEFVDL